MIELRERYASPYHLNEIQYFEEVLKVEFPSDYKVFLQQSSTGLLKFNHVQLVISQEDRVIGIDSFDHLEKVIEYWNNLINHDEFKKAQVIPIGGLLSPRTLCIGFSTENKNQLFIMDTDLTFLTIEENLEEVVSKIKYFDPY